MADAPYDLRDYVFDELTPDERAEVDRYLAGSAEAREEVERLQATRRSLLSVSEEEIPRKIAFVSDKVFEPSLTRRLWEGFWQGAPRLAFGLAAVLSVVFAGAWATHPTIRQDQSGWSLAFGQPAAVEQTAPPSEPRELTEEELGQVVQVLRESEARQREEILEVVRTATSQPNPQIRSEIEEIRQISDQNFFLLKTKIDKYERDLAESGRLALGVVPLGR